MDKQQILDKIQELKEKLPLHAKYWEVRDVKESVGIVSMEKYHSKNVFVDELYKPLSINPLEK